MSNVAELASPPSVPKPVVPTPEPDAVRRMLSATAVSDPDLAVYIRLAAVTGARPGEMCGLRWSDVGWDPGDLAIRRRVSRTESSAKLVDLTKTGKTRTVPLDASTLAVLRDHRVAMKERAALFGVGVVADGHMFSYEPDCSAFWQPMVVSRRFRSILEREGMAQVTLYSLRHQAATVMIDAGVDAKTVSERLGNSVTTVLTTYTRARTAADRAAADLMGSIYDI